MMCEECEEIEPLTVAYYGKVDRKGWRPPSEAKTMPVHDDRMASARPYAIFVGENRFMCEPSTDIPDRKTG